MPVSKVIFWSLLGIVLVACDSSGTDPQPDSGAGGNHPPSIGGNPSQQIIVGSAYLFTPTASDDDGDTLSFEIVNKPEWADFDRQNGALTGTPGVSHVGTTSDVVISVSDGTSEVEMAPFALTVGFGRASLTWAGPSLRSDNSALPLSEIDGYRIYHGPSEDQLALIANIDDASATQYTVDSLTAGTHYFAVTSYDIHGSESALSNIGTKTLP